jgi:hypothetical protein
MPTVDISSRPEAIRRHAVRSNPYREFERAAAHAEEALASLEHDDVRALLELKRKGGPGGRLLIRNGAVDPDLMPTTESTEDIEGGKGTYYSEFTLIMLGKLLGEPSATARSGTARSSTTCARPSATSPTSPRTTRPSSSTCTTRTSTTRSSPTT